MKKEIKSIQLTMSEGQAKTIINALDFYSRIGLGQFMEIKNVMLKEFGAVESYEVDCQIKDVKKAYFPKLDIEEHYIISNPDAPEQSKISWDLKQVIRNGISASKCNKGECTIEIHESIQLSISERMASVKVELEDKKLSKEHYTDVCKLGQGKECCKYLLLGAKGFDCGKLGYERHIINQRVDMTAKGDNCEGVL